MDNNIKPVYDYKKARRRFSRIGLAATAMLLITIGGQILLAWAVKTYAPEFVDTKWFTWVLSLAPMYLIALPVFCLIALPMQKSVPEKNKLSIGQWFILLMISITFMYAGNYISNILMSFISGNEATNAVTELLLDSDIWVNLVAAGLLAPIIEELLFRKVIINRTRMYGEKTAIILSALMFALFHGNFYQFFYAFGIGLVFGYVYMRTGKIHYTILMHMTINLFGGVLAPWLMSKLDDNLFAKLYDYDYLASIQTEEQVKAFFSEMAPILPYLFGLLLYALVFFGMAIAGFVLLITKRKKFNLRKTELELPREHVGGTVYLNLGMFTMIILSAFVFGASVFLT